MRPSAPARIIACALASTAAFAVLGVGAPAARADETSFTPAESLPPTSSAPDHVWFLVDWLGRKLR